MEWFINLATRTKLLLGFGLIILLLIYVIAIAYSAITHIQVSEKNLIEGEFATAIDLKDIRANQNAMWGDLYAMLVTTGPSDLEMLEQDINNRARENTERMVALLERNQNNLAILAKLKEFDAVRNSRRDARETQIMPLIREGKIEEAKEIMSGVQAEHDRKLREIADELVDTAEAATQTAVKKSAQQAEDSIRTFALAGIVAVLFSAGMILLMTRIIAVPLRLLSGISERVASGDLTVALPPANRSDEIGMLSQAFRRMVENLRQVMQEIREGANVLATAASEIVATTTQIASGAAETATAVTETTSTVEEVKKTAELSSDKTRYVSETAQKATQVSQTGKRAVEQSIEGINQVRQQMEAIVASIMKLSEQSQSIGEIIATVNDLAEQSNLLAVNAAIEATTAGEQGKRFGVVAQEIKSLAEQSKQATTQVRAILGDIQKASTAAVLVAEQGSKAVETGVRQSGEAGEAIKVLAQSITEAAQAATQIAASSQQQQAGMDQVALAMENIKQATTQNVAGTRQAETAAHNLNELGQKLKGIVEQYKL